MPLQNRVAPWGAIEAVPARGTLMGNRGILHDAQQRLGKARWRHRTWIACRLDWRGLQRPPMPPGRYTSLFFLDDGTALAAGHRPCALCRRADYERFRAAWCDVHGPADAAAIDRRLHGERTAPPVIGRVADLPPGTFVGGPAACWRIGKEGGRRWAWDGYGEPEPVPATLPVLTPPALLALLQAGYRLGLDGRPEVEFSH